MTTSFAARGLVGLVPALAIMLGANVGTSLVVQLLSFDISAVTPILLMVGVIAFKRGGRTRTRDLGRVAIGLGLMLLSLHILLDTVAPAETAPGLRALLPIVTSGPLLCVAIAAALTWAAHSSMAVVLLVMSLAFAQFITPEAAAALVLGANLGSAINPLVEGRSTDNPASLRLPLGNMLNRLVGVAVVLPFLHPLVEVFVRLEPDPARMTADFHTAFNVALALAFMLPLDGVAWLLVRVVPDRPAPADPSAPLYLDETAIGTPSVALACAAREVLHIGDVVESMLRQSMAALMTNDRKLVSAICQMDNAVDRLTELVKLYVTKVTRTSLDEGEGRRAMEVIVMAINLEHIGDIVDKNLMEIAAKKIKNKLQFSKEGAAELIAFHQRVVEHLQLAFGVFISGDVKIARRLIGEKTELRAAEMAAAESHLGRLRDGRLESIETSAVHLDVLRDLKRIHSHICSAAYPVLDAAGELQPSRLKQNETGLPLLPAGRLGDGQPRPSS
jgi:phosphate:Na+ symporter